MGMNFDRDVTCILYIHTEDLNWRIGNRGMYCLLLLSECWVHVIELMF